MNIPVLTSSGNVVVRPDQTYRHGQDSLYVPDYVDSISWSPAAFLHVCKPGRCVSPRFASRYYDGCTFGVLLYPESLIDGSEEGYASAICLNGTTYFPDFNGNAPALGEPCRISALSGDRELWSSTVPERANLEAAVERITAHCHIRIGDVLAVELARRSILCTRGDSPTSLELGELKLQILF